MPHYNMDASECCEALMGGHYVGISTHVYICYTNTLQTASGMHCCIILMTVLFRNLSSLNYT